MEFEYIKKMLNKKNDNNVNSQSPNKYQSFIEQIKTYCGPIDNKTVLEIGSDWNGDFLTEIKNSCNVKKAFGINLNSCNKEITDNIYHLKRDAADTGFENHQFDYIFSLATFEHIHNLPKVLKESWRILKPGGVLFTLFGPIWSSAWGHHLWVTLDGTTYNYKNTELSSFCHLISNKIEVKNYLIEKFEYPEDHCKIISEYIFHSNEQNRLFYDEYREIFNKSKFDVLLFVGHKNIPFSGLYEIDNYVEKLKKVTTIYPNNCGQFGFNSITALLHKH